MTVSVRWVRPAPSPVCLTYPPPPSDRVRQVGPAGSQFGLLACHFVEVIHVWPMLQRPWRALLRLLGLTAVLFLIGLLPWVSRVTSLYRTAALGESGHQSLSDCCPG